ncbi:MAG: radical SAM/SPASM domain-containing protein [bacterium]
MKKRIKHLTNLLRFNRGVEIPVIGPLKAEWEVINTCNAKCTTCLHWKNKPDSSILSTSEGKNLIKQLAESGLLKLCITGGEPLLRKDLNELIYFANGQGLSISLISNGLLITERRARELVDVNLDTIFISIDAAQANLNDKIRGLNGYFDLAMAAIDNLKSMRRNAWPNIFIKATITKLNVNQLVSLAKLAVSKGIDGLSFQLAQILENENFIFNKSLLLDAKNQEKLIEELDKVINKYGKILTGSLEYYHAMRKFFEKPDYFKQYRSVSGFSYVVIDSWGKIFTNPAKINKIGDIREDSFKNIWYGKTANELRRRKEVQVETSYLFDSIGSMSVNFSDLNLKRFFKLLRPIFHGAEFI